MADNQEQEPEDPPLGVTPGQFNQWRSHPVTKVFLAYLRDSADDIQAQASAAWADGDNMEGFREIRGGMNVLREIADVRLDAIEGFYKSLQHEEDQSAA